ncbi:hypothetical protein SLEP1_g34542 [Rubroshorea leprosula]|uniref:Uncharacterized protein n=1 Tax=Rubroshorea leprosula TaxID=152421 RepID=A0AAV5KKI9_9ROSI|nr:hypothetical protein SLEP1_g34542 [Rubroshorea leprosula]
MCNYIFIYPIPMNAKFPDRKAEMKINEGMNFLIDINLGIL